MQNHCEGLKEKEGVTKDPSFVPSSDEEKEPLPSLGPGAEKDLAWHKHDEIPTGFVLSDEYKPCLSVRTSRKEMECKIKTELERKRQGP